MSNDTPALEDAEDGEKYLEAAEVATNLREYLDVLEVERQIIETAAERLESGDLESADMMAVLPNPMPLEAWKRDEFDADADYSINPLDEVDDAE